MEKDHLAGLNQLHWETWKRKQFFFIILKTKSCTKTTIEPEKNTSPSLIILTLRYLGSHWGRGSPLRHWSASYLWRPPSAAGDQQPHYHHQDHLTPAWALADGQCLHFPLAMSFSLTYVNLVLWGTFFLLFWGSVWDLGSVSFVFRYFDFIFGVHHLQRWNLVHSVTAGGSVKFLPTV